MKYFFLQDGRTALHYAAQNGHNEVCKVLVAKGINIDAEDLVSATVLDQTIATFQNYDCHVPV